MSQFNFPLSSGEEQSIDASSRARKRVSAGAGELHIDHKPFESGSSVVIDKQITVQGPGVVFVQDTDAEVPNKNTDKPKRKAKRTKES